MFNNSMSGNKFNNSNGASVSTNIYRSFSDTCMFQVKAWNEQLSLNFAPMKGLDANGKRQYANDRSEIILTSLTKDNSDALLTGINDVIKPAITAKTAADVSVTITSISENMKKILKVSTDGTDTFISLYLGVDDSGVATGDSISHKFNKREYIVSYDPKKGTGDAVQVNSDFDNFVYMLESAKSLNQISYHNNKYGNALKGSYNNDNNPYNTSIGTNNLASTIYTGTYSANHQPQQSSNNAQVTNYGSMDEFLPFN